MQEFANWHPAGPFYSTSIFCLPCIALKKKKSLHFLKIVIVHKNQDSSLEEGSGGAGWGVGWGGGRLRREGDACLHTTDSLCCKQKLTTL